MKVAIIPARGGSKRIPRKNVREFAGRPMIGWSINAALRSGCFDHVLVSTDDREIADVATAEGAEVPFMRPDELSDDMTATTPVIRHAIEWVEANLGTPDLACCIYATAPFIEAADLQNGLEAIIETEASYAFSVTSFSFPIQRAIFCRDDGKVEMFQPEHALTRSQDLVEAFHDAGQFYWGRTDAWKKNVPVMGAASAPVFLPRKRVQDIDTQEDWDQAELMFEALRKKV